MRRFLLLANASLLAGLFVALPTMATAADDQITETIGEELMVTAQNTAPKQHDLPFTIAAQSGRSLREFGVTVNLNGVDVSRSRGSYFNLDDLEQMEVVKGPQSTLFGPAAAVGLASAIIAKPRPATSGEVRVGYGNYTQRRIDGLPRLFGGEAVVRF